MNELREKLRAQYIRGVQYGELRCKWGNDPDYVPDPYEFAAITLDAILDIFISSLPEPAKPFNIATDLIDRQEGEENYRARIVAVIKDAKETKS